MSTPGQISVTIQPQASVDLGSLDFKQPISASPLPNKCLEDHHEQHHCEHHPSSEHHPNHHHQHHNNCHNNRLRQLFLPALIILLALGGLLAWSCVSWHGWSTYGIDTLVRRAATDTASTGTGNTFVHKKRQFISFSCLIISYSFPRGGWGLLVYLIVIFVGLFVVLILGIMLSAWCCKSEFPFHTPQTPPPQPQLNSNFFFFSGSFENPLCCPCYLCACCGGLGMILLFILLCAVF